MRGDRVCKTQIVTKWFNCTGSQITKTTRNAPVLLLRRREARTTQRGLILLILILFCNGVSKSLNLTLELIQWKCNRITHSCTQKARYPSWLCIVASLRCDLRPSLLVNFGHGRQAKGVVLVGGCVPVVVQIMRSLLAEWQCYAARCQYGHWILPRPSRNQTLAHGRASTLIPFLLSSLLFNFQIENWKIILLKPSKFLFFISVLINSLIFLRSHRFLRFL